MTAAPVRLNRYLARAGVASRRAADRLIESGRVRVNGQPVRTLGETVDPERDAVEVDGRPVRPAAPPVYLILNKPPGVVTTLSDPEGRPTVAGLLPRLDARVFPVGRLDADSTGLLLLTNDGDLAYRLTHPSFEIPKTYVVGVEGEPGAGDLERLRRGVFLEGRLTAPAEVEIVRREGGRTRLRVEIHEGRKREIRRMLETLGFRVSSLERIAFAGLTLRGLKRGRWRALTPVEVRRLQSVSEGEIQASPSFPSPRSPSPRRPRTGARTGPSAAAPRPRGR